jgi:hypothetical protein
MRRATVTAVLFQEGNDEKTICFLNVVHDGAGFWRV